VSFQDEANAFTLYLIKQALPVIPHKLISGSNFATLAILGSSLQVRSVIDYVQANSPSEYRRPNQVTLLAPNLYITRINNSLDIRGSTCIGAVVFKGTSKELQRSIKSAALSAHRWGLGEILIEPGADKELEFK
jgi:hypothetical protein